MTGPYCCANNGKDFFFCNKWYLNIKIINSIEIISELPLTCECVFWYYIVTIFATERKCGNNYIRG